MTERPWVQTPTEETIFQAPFIWLKNLEHKLSGNLTGIAEYAVILQKGGWTFEDSWLIKSSYMNCKLVGRLRPKSKKKLLISEKFYLLAPYRHFIDILTKF
jgi:hypothetical protein